MQRHPINTEQHFELFPATMGFSVSALSKSQLSPFILAITIVFLTQLSLFNSCPTAL
jgi:hypothetical protein